jgi:Rrf2 family nitric oxide-sensitive transcriptional repressor
MHLTTFTDYSLRVLIYVAHAPEGRATIAEVARAFGISEHHLVKVVHALGRMGMLRNARGRGGGLRLAAAPSAINVGRVVRATESADVAECFDAERNTCALAGRCRLEGILHDAVDAFHAVLDRYTLEDLLPPPRPAHSLLPWPTHPTAPRAA